jgi:ankyrin repeat protein/L-ascorbate metabolism protein UlaG (beta-lactamase superfamily)
MFLCFPLRRFDCMRAARISTIVLVLLAIEALTAVGAEIHQAVADGDVERVAALLKTDPTLAMLPDENDRFNSLPLHLAAINGNIEIARLLLAAGADVDCGDSDESTPLHNAGLHRHPEMLAFLLENGADVNRRDRNGAYALSFAASGGDSTCVQMVLDAGADLNYWHPQGYTLFHFACSRNLHDLFDRLVAHGVDINAASTRGETPLHWAAGRADARMLNAMLDAGADPSPANEFGQTPLMNLSFVGNLENARILLSRGADPNAADQNGFTSLHAACHADSLEFVKLLLDFGADVDAVNQRGQTPLAVAAEGGDPDVVEALLVAGADPNVAEAHFGWCPLHTAAAMGYSGIAESLLEHGARPEAEDNDRLTPLDLALGHGNGAVADMLVARGADGSTVDIDAGTLAGQKDCAVGEAVIWYLFHSGWAVKTRDHFLVFDYFDPRHAPQEAGLSNGRIDPSEIAGEHVTVFVTHEHSDHYDPAIFEWREEIPNVSYVLGCQIEEDYPHVFMQGRQEREIDGMKVTTIESNDTGVGYVIEVDGLVIFHAGDHANRHQDFSGPFREEIDYLAEKGVRPDIAFMPISGCGFGDQVAVKMGVHYTLDTLKPLVFLPMHSGGGEYRYQEFVTEAKKDFPDIEMRAPRVGGDHFRYRDGRVS